jgi:hypothetical protein
MDATEQIEQLWRTIKVLQRPGELRYQLGEALYDIRRLYSERERNSGGPSAEVRKHGTFERECMARRLQPRTVRDLINDYEVMRGRDVCARAGDDSEIHPNFQSNASRQTAAEKRRAQRATRPKRSKCWSEDIGGFNSVMDDFARFARLLPYSAAKAGFREAAKRFHPDLGGDSARMIALNLVWEKLEPFYRSADGASSTDPAIADRKRSNDDQ